MTEMAIAHAPDWHAQRREGIGGSDAPVIAGVGYRSLISLWQEKRGESEPGDGTALTEWGQRLEAAVAQAAEERLGVKLRRQSRAVHYKPWPVAFAHLDYRAAGEPTEIKTSMRTTGWGEDGSADVPAPVYVQVQHQLACAEASESHVAALIGYRDFRLYHVPFDEAFWRDLLTLERDFWQQVQDGTPPEPDGTAGYREFLRRRFPEDSGLERVATPEEQLLGAERIEAKRVADEAAARLEAIDQRIQRAMGEVSVLRGPGWRVTYRHTTRRTVKWSELAESVGLLPEQVAAFTDEKTSRGPYLFKEDV
jgi:putative phage-type endonuclease